MVLMKASAPGIVLTATAISFTNEWYDTGDPNFRIPVAGFLVALLFDGINAVNEGAANGLAILMFIAVMTTPFKGKSPLETLSSLAVAQKGSPSEAPTAIHSTPIPQGRTSAGAVRQP
jgi:hypothetical protein